MRLKSKLTRTLTVTKAQGTRSAWQFMNGATAAAATENQRISPTDLKRCCEEDQ